MLMRGSAEDKNHNPTYILLELCLLFTFHKKVFFYCHVLVYKWCLITWSAFYRQWAFGEHSSLPAISLYFLFLFPNYPNDAISLVIQRRHYYCIL